jgi:YD repeat-containing protein
VRPAVVFVLCAVVFALPLSVLAAQGTATGGGARAEAPLAGGIDAQLAVPRMQWLIGDEQLKADERSALVSPQAIAARAASRNQYRGLGARAVSELAQRLFPAQVAQPAAGSPRLPAGEKIARYITPTAAAISSPRAAAAVSLHREHAVIESVEPIAHRTASGALVPIDLGLVGSGGAYTPRSSNIDVRIPKDLGRGVQLPGDGISLTPVQARGAPQSGSAGAIAGASVLYANTARDTDTTVKPTTSGFELNSILRSADSPTKLRFRVGMSAGAHLLALAAGDGARVVKGAQTLATIAAPSAVDAAGTAVPLSISVAGDVLAVSVGSSPLGWRYPIAVDPYVEDLQLTGESGGTKTRWKFCASDILPNHCANTLSSTKFTSKGWGGSGGLTLEAATYSANQWASLNYQTQGESKIYEVSGEASANNPSGNIETVAQLVNGKESVEESKWTIEKTEVLSSEKVYNNASILICPSSCAEIGGTAKNLFRLEPSATGSGEKMSETINKTVVSITQTKLPTVTYNTTSPTIEGRTNALYGSGAWVSPNGGALFEVEATDPGIGVSSFGIKTYPGAWVKSHNYIEEKRCEGVQCYPSVKEINEYKSEMPDGEDNIEALATNATPVSGVLTSFKIKVDGTAPNGLELSGLPATREFSEQSYTLSAEATDGTEGVLSSGVKSITLGVDGREITAKASGSCSPGPCTAKSEWTIGAEGMAAGTHELTVVATDNAGNISTKTYDIVARQATPVPAGPGSVNPVTGDFNLSATDVSVGSGIGGLGVSRTYNSLQLAAGSEGPLGGQWTLSTGPVEKIEKMPSEEGVVLIGGDGAATAFLKNKNGGFNSPKGDINLILSEVLEGGKTKEYVLSEPAAGTKTHFTLPEGATTGPWMPSSAEGILTAGTETYRFKTVEVAGKKITEPLEVRAPAQGIECYPTRKQGCRLLTFNYASSTTATGEGPSGWGDYNGHLTRVYLTAWDSKVAKMTTTELAQYAYDTQGRLRAEWDPRISPALKTIYGYDSAGHLTSVSAAGQQPWLLAYGANAGDLTSGRLDSIGRPPASTALGEDLAPANTAAPKLSTSSAALGKALSVTTGSWSNGALAYSYQWERCGAGGSNCSVIYGARNQGYTPVLADAGYTIVAQVTAVNAGGSTTAATSASEVVAGAAPTSALQFGTEGSGNGQLKAPSGVALDAGGDMWVTDTANNRIEEFSPTGAFMNAYGTVGNGNVQFKSPWGIAIDNSGNVYVSDQGNSRIEELSATGTFVRAFGSYGSVNGKLISPSGLAIDGEGDLWVADYGNNRLQVFSPTGGFIRTVGSVGTGNGQFKSPRGIALRGGNLYVTDSGNNRVQEFSQVGAYVSQFGSTGSGNGQLSTPVGIASAPLSGGLYVVDDGNNRVQLFTASGAYVTQFGSAGTGSAQLKGPLGMTVGAGGAVDVVDSGNNRVSQWWPTPSPAYGTSFGSTGSGNGQLTKPIDEAVDRMGNVWVTDSSNNRIEEFSPYGAFLGAYGSFGTGHGQFNSPGGIAINQSTGNIYVTDQKNGRVEEFSPTGKYIAEFGKPGSGSGEFSNPYGVAIDGSGNIWVVDLYNGRVQEFSQSENSFTLVQIVGKKGPGNGEFVEPMFLAFDNGNLYVTDQGNSRVQEFKVHNAEHEYVTQFGSKGTGNGQFEFVEGIAADPKTGELYVADTGKNRVEEFSPAGAFLGSFGSLGTGEGQFKSPVGLAFTAAGTLFVDDYGNNRIVKYAAGNVANEPPAPPEVGATAVTTIDYNVPVSGAGAPYAMGESEVAAWGQEDDPVEATAIFPPDEIQTTPASDYRRATLVYLDEVGHAVNVASPSGAIATTEYDENNAAVRHLSAANRATALAGSKSAELAKKLDSETIYNEEGTEIEETLGPEHSVKLASGSVVQARAHTVYSYDEGAPSEGGPYRLVTKTTEGAQYSGGEADVRTKAISYSGQSNLGWKLRKPTSTTIDPGGLKLTSTTIYDSLTGNVLETRSPGAGTAHGPVGGYVDTMQLNTATASVGQPGGVAIDSKGNVWQVETSTSRVDEYSSTGEFIRTFGVEGTTGGKFKKPQGIAIDSNKNVWVTDTGNNRVEEFSSTGAFLYEFGSFGETAGKFKEPTGIAIDSSGNVWVADRGNNRVEKFSPFGEFEQAVGKAGVENGQFMTNVSGVGTYQMWLAFDSTGQLWVTDGGNNRVQEFSAAGAYVGKFGGTFGEESSENGKFRNPAGIAIEPGGSIWVVDSGNNRVQQFSSTGTYISKFGSVGSGNVQFKTPTGVALAVGGNLWIGDTLNNRVEEVSNAGVWQRNVTTTVLPVKKPAGVAVDSSGNIWQVESEANRVDEYSSTGEFVRMFGTEGTGNGQFKAPQGIARDSSGNVWVTDTGNNRVEEFSSTGGFIKTFGSYGETGGQFKEPTGIAIDSSGKVWVADRGNNRVEKFSAAGAFEQAVGKQGIENGQFMTYLSGTAYQMWLAFDSSGHLWVTDGGNNRVQEFSSAGAYMSKFGNAFGEESSENGKFRNPAGIAVDSSGNLWVVDSNHERVQEMSSSGTFIAKFGENGTAPGQLSVPTGIAVDSSGRLWVGDTVNNRLQQFGLAKADPKVTQIIYYSSAANATYPECGGHVEWANLPCRTQPAVQPVASAAPKLPVTTVTYNLWDGVESAVETVGTTTRTKSSSFDSAGRLISSSVTSSVGTAVPTVTREYSTTTGALVKTSTTVSEKTQSIAETFNTLGQLISYQDADGNTSSFKYTLDGQLEEANDGKGTQSYTYDTNTAALSKIVDTAAGTFTAERDVEGRVVNEGYPNGMSAKYTYDASGATTALEYVKTTHCTEKCTWYSQSVALGIRGEMLSQSNTLANNAYVYDAVGRLTQADETPAGSGCKRRIYGYDVESNRTSLTSREPGAEGVCATSGGTIENHAYDEANRVIDTGTVYDTFGDITLLPAADAGGHEVTSSYYTSGQLYSQTQNGQTLTYYLDPSGRIRETVGSGLKSSDVISHYSGSGSAPAWTSELGEKWTRNIVGIGGSLGAIQTNGETPILQLHDLQGNIVGTASESETETKLLSSYNSTEFGVPTTSNPPKYSWGGAGGTATEMASGISNSDTSSYVPQLGRPLQTEPIDTPGQFANGSDTGAPYVSEMEPWVGESDAAWGAGAAEREAARQAASAVNAEDKVEIIDPSMTELFNWKKTLELADWFRKEAEDKKLWAEISQYLGDIQEVLGRVVELNSQLYESWAHNLENCARTIRGFKPMGLCWVNVSYVNIKLGPILITMVIYKLKEFPCSFEKKFEHKNFYNCGKHGSYYTGKLIPPSTV